MPYEEVTSKCLMDVARMENGKLIWFVIRSLIHFKFNIFLSSERVGRSSAGSDYSDIILEHLIIINYSNRVSARLYSTVWRRT